MQLMYLSLRKDIKNKLEKLKNNPKKELDAHKLYGRLKGKWSCWLSSNIRKHIILMITTKKLS